MHSLEALLQFQLATDQAAVFSLPTSLLSLTSESLQPSPHLQKWAARINSLIHSKDPGARWVGLCLAKRTSELNKTIMLDSAQSWVGTLLPWLSRIEPPHIMAECINLLTYIFTSVTDMPEYHRQVVIPNVPKFSMALVAIISKEENQNRELTPLALEVLKDLITLYPTLHRAQHDPIQNLTLQFLRGTVPTQAPLELVDHAAHLFACLNATGGKVGAGGSWKKSVESAIGTAWQCIDHLTFTLSTQQPPSPVAISFDLPQFPEDPFAASMLAVDRLKSMNALLCRLLQSHTSRPVPVPLGALVQLVSRSFRLTAADLDEAHFDHARRALEKATIPVIWESSCKLTVQLGACVKHYISPHAAQLANYLAYHLEQPLAAPERMHFIQALIPILETAHPFHNALLTARLVKALLPSLSNLLERKPVSSNADDSSTVKKRGKKGPKGYEGDEVFKVEKDKICTSREDGEVILGSIAGLSLLLQNQYLPPALRSLTSRVLTALLLTLPHYSSTAFSTDLTLHGRIYSAIIHVCEEFVRGEDGSAGRMLPLFITAASEYRNQDIIDVQHNLEVLLHPRLPPLLRSLPPLETVNLFRKEESPEEAQERMRLRVESGEMYILPQEQSGPPIESSTTAGPPLETLHSIPSASIASAPSVPLTPPRIVVESTPTTQPVVQAPPDIPVAPSSSNVPASGYGGALNPSPFVPSSLDDDEEMPPIDMNSDSE